MSTLTESRIVHSYEVATHRVRCGETQLARSTKHASGVTCAACRELLEASGAAPRGGGANDATLGT